MGGYIANFTVYTMAMIGLICFAIFVYKKFTDGTMRSGNSKFLDVEESMSLSPRKTLHVVRAGNEKFLIASDVDRTTLISKLSQPTRDNLLINEDFSQIKPEENVINLYQPQKQSQKQPLTQQQERIPSPNYVHLEPIKQKSKMDRRLRVEKQNVKNTVTLDFETPKSHGFSTMKEMAMKINEL